MGYILMQPVNDDVSRHATIKLIEGGDCLFDLKRLGACFQELFYSSRSCTGLENQSFFCVGISRRIISIYGAHISIGYAFVKQCQKYWSMMEILRYIHAYHKNSWAITLACFTDLNE